MNILYHHRTQGKGVEGVHINGIQQALKKMGHALYVVSPVNGKTGGLHNPEALRERNKMYAALSKMLPEIVFEALELLYNFASYLAIVRLSKRLPVDFIYERYAFFSLSALMAARRMKIPFLLEVNYTSYTPVVRERSKLLMPVARWIERFVLTRADIVFVVSSYLRQHVMNLGVPQDKICLTPNAVDGEVFSAQCDTHGLRSKIGAEDKHVIGFVGGFYPWHGLELLLKAVQIIESKIQNIHLLLAGEGPMKERLPALARELNLGSELFMPGIIPYTELPRYISVMDVCVMPNSNDYGSPMKVFEYMAMGKPVVAPRLSPLEDVIIDGYNGILFNPGVAHSLAYHLFDLLSNQAKREEIGRQARRTIYSRHLWKHNAQRIIDAYHVNY